MISEADFISRGRFPWCREGVSGSGDGDENIMGIISIGCASRGLSCHGREDRSRFLFCLTTFFYNIFNHCDMRSLA